MIAFSSPVGFIKRRMTMRHARFLNMLMRQSRSLHKLKPKEVMIFNVSGNFGNYQIMIGPENVANHTRPIEINGSIHHLFVTKNRIEPLPTREEVTNNLRGTIIMNDITVHLFDKNGDGKEVLIERNEMDGAHAREQINLAGDEGDQIMHESETTGRLANETYQIVQEDILRSLHK